MAAVQLLWKIVIPLPYDGPKYLSANELFHLRTSKTLLKKIGGMSRPEFIPNTLEPTHIFYNAISSIKKAGNFTGKKFPFYFNVGNPFSLESVKVNIRLFGLDVVMLTITTTSSEIDIDMFDLESAQRLESHKELYDLVKAICGLVYSGNRLITQFHLTPKYFPCVFISNTQSSETISDSKAVELLIRHRGTLSSIVEDVLHKNNGHKLDSNSILIDRQGIVARASGCEKMLESGIIQFNRSQCIFELAVAISRLITTEKFNNLSLSQQQSIAKLINNPDVIINQSTTALKTWKLLQKEFVLKEMLSDCLTHNDISNEDYTEPSSVNNKQGWSNKKSTIVSISVAMLIALLSWVGIEKKLNLTNSDKIAIHIPIDGSKFMAKQQKLDFEWLQVKSAKHYILFVEKYRETDAKWVPYERITTHDHALSLPIKQSGQYRWRIIARNSDMETIGNSELCYLSVL